MVSALSFKRASGLIALMVVLVAMALVCLLMPPAARAQGGNGDITGNVTAADTGDPMNNCPVTAYGPDGTQVATTNSGPTGDWTIPGIAVGTYSILFNPADGLHCLKYYHNKSSRLEADPVVVTAGQTTTGIDQAVPLGGSITGIKRDATTHLAMPASEVKLWFVTWTSHNKAINQVGQTMTDGNGAYEFKGLASGPYLVESYCEDQIHTMSWFYDGKASNTEADTVTVNEGVQTTNIDLDVPNGGKIDGTVTDSLDNTVTGATCTAYWYDPVKKIYIAVGAIATDGNGYYSLGPLQPGRYKVSYTPCQNPQDYDHMFGWYRNKTGTIDGADTLDVVELQTTTADNVMVSTGKITGFVRSNDAMAGPIESCAVYAYHEEPKPGGGTQWVQVWNTSSTVNHGNPNAEAWGAYLLNGLPPGNYKVQYIPSRKFWAEQYYKGKTTLASATVLQIAPGETKEHADVNLEWINERYACTTADHSNFGSVLSSAGYRWNQLSLDLNSSYDLVNKCLLKRFDAIFIECSDALYGTYKNLEMMAVFPINDSPLDQYVREGGTVFVSDIAGYILNEGFGSPMTFGDPAQEGVKQSISTSITNSSLRSYLGFNVCTIKYDKGGTSVVKNQGGASTQYMRGNVVTDHEGTLLNSPMCFSIPYGEGKVIYQSFHLDKQDSTISKPLLAFFLGQSGGVPQITSQSTTSGPVGATVTINGSKFGSTRDPACNVKFNTTQVAESGYKKWSDTQIQVVVPNGATTGPVKVTNSKGTSNGVSFTVVSGPSTPTTWFLAEGSTDWGFDTYVNIENPSASQVTCDVTYMTADGPVGRAPITMPAYSQVTINPKSDVGATDFSTKVVCKEGKTIAVDRRMVWTGPGAPSQEGHSSIGVTYSSNTWYLAEGSSKWGFETWLLVQNPTSTAATLDVTYMIEGAGPKKVVKTVLPNSRSTWSMAGDIGENDASVKISSTTSVIAERSMYRNNKREGHESIGTPGPSNTYYLAEGTTGYGFTTYVLVQNPNTKASTVTLTYMTGSGAKVQPSFNLAAQSRKTIRVNDVSGMQNQDFSTKVVGSQPIIAERAMYWGAGSTLGEACHASIGLDAPHGTFYLPDGETQNGYETWTCVQNPNSSAVTIQVQYLSPQGGTTNMRSFTDTIPANSRRTYDMRQYVSGKAAIVVTCQTSGKKIMVERSMYWNSRGAGTNTIGGFTN
jgi:hypothetical protein